MAEPTRTPITIESLVALGGTIEDKINVRFGREIAYCNRAAWYIAGAHFVYLEAFADWLKNFGKSIGFRRVEP